MKIPAGWKGLWAASAVVASIGVARADDGTTREQQLETRVNELERQLAEVNKRLAQSGANASGSELEQRVEELEKFVRKDQDGMAAYWKNGLRIENPSGAFKMHVGGFFQVDWNFFAHNQDFEEAFGREIEAGVQFRRARLLAEGTMYKNIDYKAEFEFAGGGVAFRNVWLAFKGLPMGSTLTVGSMKQPFGLEELTPDIFTSFMERSAPSIAFAPSYDTGFQLSNTFCDERGTWQFGAFREAGGNGDDTGNSISGEWNLAGRVAGRPWVSEDKSQFFHAGGAVLFRQPANDGIGFKSTPELNQAGTFVDTGTLTSHQTWQGELETAFQSGPFTVIGEAYLAMVDAREMSDPTFHGWSVEGSWFLTGEGRGYNAPKAVFDRVAPKHNWDDAGGSGAWQLVARFDVLDLNDADVEGGHMQTASIGINWYANPNTKVMLAIVHPDVRDIGSMWGFETRFQVDF